MSKIIYLEARGRGGFRSRLHSDTLWGSICWAIRYLQDSKEGQPNDILATVNAYPYQENAAADKDFYLSSAFPWCENQEGAREHFLPHPLLEVAAPKKITATDPRSIKVAIRKEKLAQKKGGWISWAQLNHQYRNGVKPAASRLSPVLKTQAITHNLIDRRRLGTLTVGKEGQLFHMNENYLQWQDPDGEIRKGFRHGFYFFLDGNDEWVLPALRLLSTLGVGGDRTNGKGSFDIYWQAGGEKLSQTYALPPLEDANASMCLSLYHPSQEGEELSAYANEKSSYWQYKLESRQGRNVHQGDYLQNGYLFFKEGSVFPKVEFDHRFPGKNLDLGKHRLGHTIYRYGHAYMLDLKL